MNKLIFLKLVIFSLLITSCKSTNGNNWLIKTTEVEISVNEAGNTWDNLDQEAKIRFLSENNSTENFISALGRKAIILEEIDNEFYLYLPKIQNMKKCWITNFAFLSYADSLSASIERNLTETDFLNYRQLLGSMVWFTSDTNDATGPVRLPELPWPLAFAFDSMTIGSSIELNGISYRLDSITASSQDLIDATIADSVAFNSFVKNSLVESRTRQNLEKLKTEVLQTYFVDSTAVYTYCSNRQSLADSTVLASWDNGSGSVSALEFDGIASFLTLTQPLNTYSPSWVFHNLRNQARLIYIANIFAQEFPEEYNNFNLEAETFAIDQATELLFKNNVIDSISLSDSLILQAYLQLDSIPLVPETRIFQSVMIPGELVDSAIVLLNSDTALLELGYPGYTEFLADNDEFLSRPVQINELPYEMDLILFILEENDTKWQRPVEVTENLFVFYRLIEIISPHEATFEQLENTIRIDLFAFLQEQKTVEWMLELETKHNLQINSEILTELPADPSAWSEF